MLGVPAGALIKALPVIVEGRGPRARARARRPPPQRDQAARTRSGRRSRPARRGGGRARSAPRRASSGPVGAQTRGDRRRGAARACAGWSPAPTSPTSTCAAWSRAATSSPPGPTCARVEAGDTCPTGGTIRIEPAIEVGNIFKLGTRYTEPLGRHLPRRGRQRAVRSGWAPTASARRASSRPRSSSSPTSRASPGRGRWPRSTSSWSRSASAGEQAREAADRLYEELRDAGLDVLYDDRDASAGREVRRRRAARLPAAADGGQARGRGRARWRPRSGAARRSARCRSTVRPQAAAELWRDPPLTRSASRARRLLGLDRSGAPPPETLPGEPLRPVHDPERDRLRPAGAAAGVPRAGARDRRRPQHRRVAALFAFVAGTDYLDGLAPGSPASTAGSARCSTRSPTARSCSRA